jgi:dihydropteroate synthase
MPTKSNTPSRQKVIKPGDNVFAINNACWGDKAMRVISVYQGGAICKHPDHAFTGGFRLEELAHVTRLRQSQLKQYRKAVKVAAALRKELFGS